MAGSRCRIGAAIVADRYASRARGFQIIGVVAGAQRLHDPQLRRGLVEFRAVLKLAGADVILRVFQQLEEFGSAMRGSGQLPAGWQQIVGNGERLLGMGAGSENAWHVASPLWGNCRAWLAGAPS